MPPERPPATTEPRVDADREQRLHDLFAGFRAWLRPTHPGRRAAVLEAIRAARAERRRGPAMGTVLGAGLVQILNLAAAALGRGDEARHPNRRAPAPETDDDQP